jgi:hypothetical protein
VAKEHGAKGGFISFMRIAIVAPHASPVPMDGGSIRSRAIADVFATAGYEVFFFGREEHLRITKEEGTNVELKIPRGDSKLVPALLSLLRRSHYVKEKHMPERWVAATCKALDSLRIETVLLSFVWSNELVQRLNYKPRVLVDTHNNEVEWFENLMAREKSVLGRMVCRNSIRYALRAIDGMDAATELVHVSERDREFYARKRPDLLHWVLPNGCFVKPRPATPDYTHGKKQLFFLGSLSTSMNQDALAMFADKFWPVLKNETAFTVIGSNPPPSVSALCEKNGWVLLANPDGRELDRRLERMHYAVLPFPYGAGSKLKLLDACAQGIPVLATGGGVTGFANLPAGVFVSEDADEWLQKLRQNSFSQADRDGLLEFARSSSWENLVKQFMAEAKL